MRSTLKGIVVSSLIVSLTIDAGARPRRSRVAQPQVESDRDDRDDRDDRGDEDGDGPEGRAVLKIKLDELIEVAVRLSPDLMRARVDRVIAKDVAEGERRGQAWIVSSSVEHKRNAVAERVETPLFSPVADVRTQGFVGLGRNLPTGGSFRLEAGLAHSDTEYNVPDQILTGLAGSAMAPAGTNANGDYYEHLVRDSASIRATFKQPIARGMGPTVALANEKKADFAATEATVKAQLAAEEMVRDVVAGYWELAYKAHEVDVRQQALDLAEKQDQVTHEQMRAGSVPSSALNAVTYEIAIRQEALLRAQLEYEQLSLDLRRKTGLELGRREIVMRPGDAFEVGDVDYDVEAVLERSRSANRKLATLQLQKKIADVELAVASDQVRPQFDLTVSGALIGQGDGTASAIGAVSEGYEVSVGVSLSFELSGAARKARDAARARKKRLDVDRADLERQLDTQVVTSVHQVTSGRTRVALSDKAILVAEENVRAERASFMAGRTTNFQVMQRQTELVEARLRRGRAIADYHRAVAQLQFLSGEILDSYRVNVRPAVAERR